jgi:hypothetical protein
MPDQDNNAMDIFDARLTFAELEALIGSHDRWPAVRQALALAEVESEQVVASGYASLMARGLAEIDGDDINVDEALFEIASRLTHADTMIGITIVQENNATALMLYTADYQEGNRLLTVVFAPGVFSLVPFKEEGTILDQAYAIVSDALRKNGAVFVSTPDEPAVVIQRIDDQWLIGDPEADNSANAYSPIERDAALELVHNTLDRQIQKDQWPGK